MHSPRRSLSQNSLSDPRFLGGIVGVFLLGALTACAPARPSIPAPTPQEIIEITLDHRTCDGDRCASVVVNLHQLGGASQAYYTGERYDSTLLSGIDSAAFADLATRLVENGYFMRGAPIDTAHDAEPFYESWVLTVTTTERRWPVRVGGQAERDVRLRAYVGEVEVVRRRLRWHVPVG